MNNHGVESPIKAHVSPIYSGLILMLPHQHMHSKLDHFIFSMSSITTSSKGHSPSSLYVNQESHWSEDSISKPKPVLVSKRSLCSLGFHPPYTIGDPAYLRFSSDTPNYHLYQFKGAHISSLSTLETRYYTSVFELDGQHGHNVYAFDITEDCETRRRFRVPKFIAWLRTWVCPCIPIPL